MIKNMHKTTKDMRELERGMDYRYEEGREAGRLLEEVDIVRQMKAIGLDIAHHVVA